MRVLYCRGGEAAGEGAEGAGLALVDLLAGDAGGGGDLGEGALLGGIGEAVAELEDVALLGGELVDGGVEAFVVVGDRGVFVGLGVAADELVDGIGFGGFAFAAQPGGQRGEGAGGWGFVAGAEGAGEEVDGGGDDGAFAHEEVEGAAADPLASVGGEGLVGIDAVDGFEEGAGAFLGEVLAEGGVAGELGGDLGGERGVGGEEGLLGAFVVLVAGAEAEEDAGSEGLPLLGAEPGAGVVEAAGGVAPEGGEAAGLGDTGGLEAGVEGVADGFGFGFEGEGVGGGAEVDALALAFVAELGDGVGDGALPVGVGDHPVEGGA